MVWLSLVPAFAVALLLLVLPGAALSWTLGLRRFEALSFAPALSMSAIAVASTGAPFLHLSWSFVPLIGTTLVAGVILLAIRLLLRRFDRGTGQAIHRTRPIGELLRLTLVYIVAVGLPAVLIARSLLVAFDRPDSFSQTFDNVFHLNALQYIRETGSASSLTLGNMAGSSYYPAAWHAFVSLVGQASSVGIPESVNAANLAIGAVVWPLSVIFLVLRIFGRHPLALVGGGVLAASFAAFPLLMVDYGVLYPNYLALAILPACVGQLFHAAGLGDARPANIGREWVVLGAGVIGMTIAHPSALMALVAAAVLPALQCYLRKVSPLIQGRSVWRSRPIVLPSAALLCGFVVAGYAWKVVRPDPAAAFWPPTQSIAQAVGEALAAAPVRMEPNWLIVGLVLVGVYRCIRTPGHRTVLGLFAVMAALYVVVSGFDPGQLRNFVAGVWYNDSVRLAAMLPMGALPVALEGMFQVQIWLVGAYRAVTDALGRTPLSPRAGSSEWTTASVAGVGIVALVLTAASLRGQVPAEALAARGLYQVRPDSPLINTDELALLQRLDSHVPPNALIVGSPWTGTSLAYALAGRKTLQLHILSPTTPEADAIDTGLRDAPGNAVACNAIRDLHVEYVLDFGSQEVHYQDHPYHGVENLEGSHAVELVDQQGAAKLYKVTACQG